MCLLSLDRGRFVQYPYKLEAQDLQVFEVINKSVDSGAFDKGLSSKRILDVFEKVVLCWFSLSFRSVA